MKRNREEDWKDGSEEREKAREMEEEESRRVEKLLAHFVRCERRNR